MNRTTYIIQLVLAIGSSLFISSNTLAQSSAEETARELANPNTALASLTFKNIYTRNTGNLPGADSESGFTTLFQPSLPFPLDNGDKFIFRPALPIIGDAPVFNGESLDFDSESGIGDIGFDFIYASTSAAGFLTGYGIAGTLPTASEEVLGKDKWSLGPEIFFGQISETSVIGALINHQWDIDGSDDVVEDVNLTTINIFGSYLPGGGWNLGSSPIISYDWESEQWTVPLNFSFGKTVIFGDQPVKLGMEFNYYVEQSDQFGPDWSVTLTITPVVSNVIAGWFD